MGSEPAVSIISPTYNHEAFLGQCIDSVLAQTFSSWEQIIIDDGSTDATPEVARRYTDPRVRYVRQENVGILRLAETYNRALALCRAPLVAILEGDDYWPEDRLRTLVPCFEDPQVVLAYGLTKVVGDHQQRMPPTIPTPSFRRDFPLGTLDNDPVGAATRAMLDVRGLTFTYPCAVLIRKDALLKVGGFRCVEGLPVTDYPTFLRLSLLGRFRFVEEVTGFWRYHRGSTTAQRWEAILGGVLGEIREFRRIHGTQLNFTPREWARIDLSWRQARAWLEMRAGRRCALDGAWPAARRHFTVAVRDGRAPTRFAGFLALVASWMRADIESLYRMAKRPWFRRSSKGTHEIVS